MKGHTITVMCLALLVTLHRYIRSWVRRRHVFEKHRHTGLTGGTLRMRKEGIPKLFGRNNAILQPKHELDW